MIVQSLPFPVLLSQQLHGRTLLQKGRSVQAIFRVHSSIPRGIYEFHWFATSPVPSRLCNSSMSSRPQTKAPPGPVGHHSRFPHHQQPLLQSSKCYLNGGSIPSRIPRSKPDRNAALHHSPTTSSGPGVVTKTAWVEEDQKLSQQRRSLSTSNKLPELSPRNQQQPKPPKKSVSFSSNMPSYKQTPTFHTTRQHFENTTR